MSINVQNRVGLQDETTLHQDGERTPLQGRRHCHLVLVPNALTNQTHDFLRIAEYIKQYDRKITTTIVTNRARGLGAMVSRLHLPTLMISLVPLSRFRPLRGRFLHGRPLSKSEEYAALEAAGFPVPKWQRYVAGQPVDEAEYGPYAVSKPNRGMRGALVKIKRTRRIGKNAETVSAGKGYEGGRYAPGVDPQSEFLIQKFIYTGKWPVSYRVTTLFGKVLHSVKYESSHDRQPLLDTNNFDGIASIVATGRGCSATLNRDEEIIRLGEDAHKAFPDIPLLGFDIVREVSSGNLYIVEANAMGYVWHFSSTMGKSIQQENHFCFEDQFDGIRKAAKILAMKTQELAQ